MNSLLPLVPVHRAPRRRLQRVRAHVLQGALTRAHGLRRAVPQRAAPARPTSSSSATAGGSNAGARIAKPTSPGSARSTTACSRAASTTGGSISRPADASRATTATSAASAWRPTERACQDRRHDRRPRCVQPRRAVRDRSRPLEALLLRAPRASPSTARSTRPTISSAQLLGLTPPLGMTAVYLFRDGFVLELLHFAAAGQTQAVPAADDERARPHACLAVGRGHRRGGRRGCPSSAAKCSPRPTSARACSSGIPTVSSSSSCRWPTAAALKT